MFLQRVVHYLTAQVGLRQFLDIGSGLPSQGNVHEVAQKVDAGARVVYVDNDPVVLVHARDAGELARRSSLISATSNCWSPALFRCRCGGRREILMASGSSVKAQS
jgi:hypothetical protein